MHLVLPQVEPIDTYVNGRRIEPTEPGGRIREDEDTDGLGGIQQRESAIYRLASKISAQSSAQSPFQATPGGPCDPNGPNFNSKTWINAQRRNRGVAFRDLSVHGFGSATEFQKTVGNIYLDAIPMISKLLGNPGHKVQILRDFEGVLNSGELLCVLGPPGSGCSTLLKALAGETHGLHVDDKAYLNYRGIKWKEMRTRFRGEATYTAEDDYHLPMLSVGDTLEFAALARSPRDLPNGMSRKAYAKHLSDVIMAAFGISHTRNTRVGDNFVRGISGGERKRVSIAEALLSDAPLQCWGNSTRGLDSANAIEFCKALRLCSDIFGTAAAVAIYQAPQAAYDLFDKVVVLYEGRQIYFGDAAAARHYFEQLGFVCPKSQTTPDFLTSMTNPAERVVQPGCENSVPRTPDDFASAWLNSESRRLLQKDVEEYVKANPFHGEHLKAFTQVRKQEQARFQRARSPYTLSYLQQIQICLWRGFKLLRGDPTITLVQLGANFIQFLIVRSVFYNLSESAGSLFHRGMIIFTSLILNAFASILEILTLYAKRRIVEKHNRYALYHPSAEALAAMLVDLPYKVINAIVVNTTLYFMANLRLSAGPFFFFLLISFSSTLTMSMLFRFVGSTTKTASQALAPTTVILLATVLFTIFSIPVSSMLGWCRWINYLSPLAWAFESLVINELAGRSFPCSTLVPYGPGYDNESLASRACDIVGATQGTDIVSGAHYIEVAFGYVPSHRWRNFGIVVGFMLFFLACNLITSEVVALAKSKGEVLVFLRGKLPPALRGQQGNDLESTKAPRITAQESGSYGNKGAKQSSVFHWRNVCYDVQIKSETRRILNHVDGWVKPGTLTALMGVSGAGKTTLLDALACRITMGVVSGDMLVNGRIRNDSFQRKTGYVQQQDLHLGTATVREALVFSALLRQPESSPEKKKVAYVDEVIDLLEMRDYADAIIGEIGEGLNVEQRKRLSIGVELAAKPQLLLFLDEPTSGLDSQTSWSICNLMRKLATNGQAILCTIHQPSAMLFTRFDRLLLLARGGRTVYFGDIGKDSQVLVQYFVSKGASPCPQHVNPAEWMLSTIGAAPGVKTEIDWPQQWQESTEKMLVDAELEQLAISAPDPPATAEKGAHESQEFAAPLMKQTAIVTKRIFQQYWRSPSYIYSKALLGVGSMIFIGFSFFQASRTQQGLRSQLFGIFALLTTFMSFVEQKIPFFVVSRSLYEVRERPSKSYSWKAFMLANMMVEIPWNLLVGTFMFLCWWFAIGLYNNTSVTDTTDSRATLAFLLVCMYMLMISTFSHFMIAGIDSAETASNIANVLGFVMLLFCGILATPTFMPGFWIWMYRCNPFTYLTEGLLAAGLAKAPAECASNEWLIFEPPSNQNCGDYMAEYTGAVGGNLLDPTAQTNCQFCPISDTDAFLSAVGVSYGNRWRDFGILWVFVVSNLTAAIFLYWLLRVPKKNKKVKVMYDKTAEEKTQPSLAQAGNSDRSRDSRNVAKVNDSVE